MAEQPTPKTRKPSIRESLEEHAPWKPAKWEPADATALQALWRGDCPAHLQQRAIKFIMYELCGLRDLSYRPGGQEGDRDTCFAEGKQFVGKQIAKLIDTKIVKAGEQP